MFMSVSDKCSESVHLNFDVNMKDKSGRNTQIGNSGVRLTKYGTAKFNGASSLKLWNLGNVDYTDKFALKFKFKFDRWENRFDMGGYPVDSGWHGDFLWKWDSQIGWTRNAAVGGSWNVVTLMNMFKRTFAATSENEMETSMVQIAESPDFQVLLYHLGFVPESTNAIQILRQLMSGNGAIFIQQIIRQIGNMQGGEKIRRLLLQLLTIREVGDWVRDHSGSHVDITLQRWRKFLSSLNLTQSGWDIDGGWSSNGGMDDRTFDIIADMWYRFVMENGMTGPDWKLHLKWALDDDRKKGSLDKSWIFDIIFATKNNTIKNKWLDYLNKRNISIDWVHTDWSVDDGSGPGGNGNWKSWNAWLNWLMTTYGGQGGSGTNTNQGGHGGTGNGGWGGNSGMDDRTLNTIADLWYHFVRKNGMTGPEWQVHLNWALGNDRRKGSLDNRWIIDILFATKNATIRDQWLDYLSKRNIRINWTHTVWQIVDGSSTGGHGGTSAGQWNAWLNWLLATYGGQATGNNQGGGHGGTGTGTHQGNQQWNIFDNFFHWLLGSGSYGFDNTGGGTWTQDGGYGGQGSWGGHDGWFWGGGGSDGQGNAGRGTASTGGIVGNSGTGGSQTSSTVGVGGTNSVWGGVIGQGIGYGGSQGGIGGSAGGQGDLFFSSGIGGYKKGQSSSQAGSNGWSTGTGGSKIGGAGGYKQGGSWNRDFGGQSGSSYGGNAGGQQSGGAYGGTTGVNTEAGGSYGIGGSVGDLQGAGGGKGQSGGMFSGQTKFGTGDLSGKDQWLYNGQRGSGRGVEGQSWMFGGNGVGQQSGGAYGGTTGVNTEAGGSYGIGGSVGDLQGAGGGKGQSGGMFSGQTKFGAGDLSGKDQWRYNGQRGSGRGIEGQSWMFGGNGVAHGYGGGSGGPQGGQWSWSDTTGSGGTGGSGYGDSWRGWVTREGDRAVGVGGIGKVHTGQSGAAQGGNGGAGFGGGGTQQTGFGVAQGYTGHTALGGGAGQAEFGNAGHGQDGIQNKGTESQRGSVTFSSIDGGGDIHGAGAWS